jgi:flagellar biosynthesis GTPase FlhF
VKTTRYIGNCQICAKDYKVRGGIMVHHGFVRPGDGQIYGDCPGAGHPPYESSVDELKRYADRLVGAIMEAEKRLRELQRGEITTLKVKTGHRRVETLNVNTADPRVWQRALERHIDGTGATIRNLRREQDFVRERICDWKEMPLRTVEEEVRKEDRAKEERKAERERKRAEKEAKRAEYERKAAERYERRTQQKEAYVERIHELAEDPDAKAKKEAIKITRRMFKQMGEGDHYPYIQRWDADTLQALIDLGVVEQTQYGPTYNPEAVPM